jgi:hypothetical protein
MLCLLLSQRHIGGFATCCSTRAKPISDSGVQVEPFITNINIRHHLSYSSQTSIVSGIVSGIGCSYFRTDMVLSERMQDIRSVQTSLSSCAVTQELDSKQFIHLIHFCPGFDNRPAASASIT